MQAAAGTEVDASDAETKWTILALQSAPVESQANQVMKDTQSQRSGQSFLSKEKLSVFDKVSQKSHLPSQALPSQTASQPAKSVALSKAITQTTKLSKIEEDPEKEKQATQQQLNDIRKFKPFLILNFRNYS